jgi:putative membrane protein
MRITRWLIPMAAAAVFAIGAVTAVAQTRPDPGVSDQQLLSRLHLANTQEISLSQIAKDKAVEPQVRNYANMMIKQHTTAESRVTTLAKQLNIELAAVIARNLSEAGDLRGDVKRGKMLREQKGRNVDALYLRMMIEDHQQLLGFLENEQAHVDNANLRTLVTSLIPTVRSHLQQARNLLNAVVREQRS